MGFRVTKHSRLGVDIVFVHSPCISLYYFENILSNVADINILGLCTKIEEDDSKMTKRFQICLVNTFFRLNSRENVLPLDRGISFPVGVCISWSLCKPRDVTLYSSGPLRSLVSVFSVSPLSIRIFVFCKVIVSNFASAAYMYNVHCTTPMSGIGAIQYYNPIVPH